MKLFLMAFGFLIAATVSAQEPKGSFELSPTNPTVAMVNVEENKECDRSGDIGMSADGLILSCQSGIWKTQSQGSEYGGSYSLTRHYTGSFARGCRTANRMTKKCSCPSGFSARQVSAGAINHHWVGDRYVYGYTCEK
jgi:hypothetical protein